MAESIVTKYELDVTQFQQKLVEIETKLGIVKAQGQTAAKGISNSFNTSSIEVQNAIKKEIAVLDTLNKKVKEFAAAPVVVAKLNAEILQTQTRIAALNAEASKGTITKSAIEATVATKALNTEIAKTEVASSSAFAGVNKAYSFLKVAANVIPGLGISGLFLLAYESISQATKAMGFFNDTLVDSAKAAHTATEAYILQEEALRALKGSIDSIDVNIKKNDVDILKARLENAKIEEQINGETVASRLDLFNKKKEIFEAEKKIVYSEIATNKIRISESITDQERLNKEFSKLGSDNTIENKQEREADLIDRQSKKSVEIDNEYSKWNELIKQEDTFKTKLELLQIEYDRKEIKKGAEKNIKIIKSEIEFHEEINKDYELYLKQKEQLIEINLKNDSNNYEILKRNFEKHIQEQDDLVTQDIRSQARANEIKLLLQKQFQHDLTELIKKEENERLAFNRANIIAKDEIVVGDSPKGSFKELKAQRELAEDKNRFAYATKRAELEEFLRLDKTLTDAEISAALDKNEQLLKIKQDGIKAQKKLDHDYMVAQINRVQEAGKTIFSAIEQNQKHQQALTGLKLTKEEKQQNIERERAEKGLKNNLAFEDKRVAALEKKQIDAEKRMQRTKLLETFLNSLAEYSKRDPDTAIPKALVQQALSLAAIATFAEDGGLLGDGNMQTSRIGIVANPFMSRTHTGGGDILLHAQSGEGILSRKEVSALGGKEGFYDLKKQLNYGQINKDISKLNYVSTATVIDISPLQQEMSEIKMLMKNQKQFDSVKYIEEQNKFIIAEQTNNIKTITELQYRKKRIG